jgi:hypothetical protein
MRLAVLIGAVLLGAAACGGSEQAGDKPSGLLVVKQTQAGGPYYIEGSKSYVRAEPGGDDVELSSSSTPAASLKLAPGNYTLKSWQRPCDGNCGVLDEPTDRCSGPVTITAGGETRVTIKLRPGKGCEIVAG